ncbi:alpha-amylase, partial [Plakobranchus ocellatus]
MGGWRGRASGVGTYIGRKAKEEWKWWNLITNAIHLISPPNENIIVTSDVSRPWWERYQPVSYKLDTRSGDESSFKDMVDRCKAVGVRIYADVVINHMAAFDRSGTGTGGSPFNGAIGEFPGVPFSARHFHTFSDCGARGDIDYQDTKQVRNCDLLGLKDLDHSQSYVQDKVAEYLNKLIDLGVAGFRVDAAKHMWPRDIAAIQKKVNDLPEGGRPFFYFEVIDWNTEAIKDDLSFGICY